jgi:hypothetical protein
VTPLLLPASEGQGATVPAHFTRSYRLSVSQP